MILLFMDSLTHTFAVMIIAADVVSGPYLFALVLGAVIPDIDILFKPMSDQYPVLFIATHGGFTHSILGSLAVAFLALLGIAFAAGIGMVPAIAMTGSWTFISMLLAAGALSHLFLDVLAYPGIPLLYPFSSKRITVGIFPGPSIVLLAASAGYTMLVLFDIGNQSSFSIYTAFFLIFISSSAVLTLYIHAVTEGIAIPTLHPLRWLLISENDWHYSIQRFSPNNSLSPLGIYEKYLGTTENELRPLFRSPEYQRMRFYSYIITAERNGDIVTFRDPLRKDRIIFYPPFYSEIHLPLPPSLAPEGSAEKFIEIPEKSS
jgi:inner membrane protein